MEERHSLKCEFQSSEHQSSLKSWAGMTATCSARTEEAETSQIKATLTHTLDTVT